LAAIPAGAEGSETESVKTGAFVDLDPNLTPFDLLSTNGPSFDSHGGAVDSSSFLVESGAKFSAGIAAAIQKK